MNQTSFQVGDRVRHKVTQIEGEIMQMEESLAMPHAWVIEPSECEFNPQKLYRLIDLEKVEDSGEGAQKTNQAQGVNPNISLSDREPEVNNLTSNDLSGESVLTFENNSVTHQSAEGDSLTSNDFSTSVLTVEPELITLCSDSVSGEQITSKLLPISVKSSSNPINNTSTANELLRDKSTDQIDISLSKKGSEVEDDLTLNELLRDKSTDQIDISLSKNWSEVEDDLTLNELLRDKGTDQTNISLSKNENETGVNNSTSKKLSSDKSTQQADLSPGKSRRYKGHGSGTISWRTLTKNGRDYHQPWYQYEFWDKGKCTLKSSKYIPKVRFVGSQITVKART